MGCRAKAYGPVRMSTCSALRVTVPLQNRPRCIRAQPANARPPATIVTLPHAIQGLGGTSGRTRIPKRGGLEKTSAAPPQMNTEWAMRAVRDCRATVVAVERAATSQPTNQTTHSAVTQAIGEIMEVSLLRKTRS